jgi:hypothetical protein
VDAEPASGGEVSAARARPTVLYIMGAGRSGSTILGVALGNCQDVFFAGELDRWFARSGVPRDGARRASFWSSVLEQVGDAEDLFVSDTTVLERSSTLLHLANWRARRRLRGRYREVSQALYLAIARASGATHIVDSSHYPLRARELMALPDIDLHLLFLVRDPQSVVASLGRRDVAERRFAAPAANAYLWLTYMVSVLVFLSHPRRRRLLVRHEDFLADPEGVLRQILTHCGAPSGVPDLAALQVGVPFHGNRLIKADEVALRPHRDAPVRRSLLTSVLQLPWAPVLSRLRPAAGSGERRERSGAAD